MDKKQSYKLLMEFDELLAELKGSKDSQFRYVCSICNGLDMLVKEIAKLREDLTPHELPSSGEESCRTEEQCKLDELNARVHDLEETLAPVLWACAEAKQKSRDAFCKNIVDVLQKPRDPE